MSNGSTQNRVDEIFLEACEVSTSKLKQFLDEACGDDSKILAEVEKLLKADRYLKSNENALPEPQHQEDCTKRNH